MVGVGVGAVPPDDSTADCDLTTTVSSPCVGAFSGVVVDALNVVIVVVVPDAGVDDVLEVIVVVFPKVSVRFVSDVTEDVLPGGNVDGVGVALGADAAPDASVDVVPGVGVGTGRAVGVGVGVVPDVGLGVDETVFFDCGVGVTLCPPVVVVTGVGVGVVPGAGVGVATEVGVGVGGVTTPGGSLSGGGASLGVLPGASSSTIVVVAEDVPTLGDGPPTFGFASPLRSSCVSSLVCTVNVLSPASARVDATVMKTENVSPVPSSSVSSVVCTMNVLGPASARVNVRVPDADV